MNQWIRYLRGYLHIRISGDFTERFLNSCKYKNIYLWDLTTFKNAFEFKVSIKDYYKLKSLFRKTKTHVKILQKKGLPFLISRYRSKKLFLPGFFICIFLIYFLSSFLWKIEFTGNHLYTDEILLKTLEESGIKTGIPLSKLDCTTINSQLRDSFEDITWVSASRHGSKLFIQIKENNGIFSDSVTYTNENPVDIIATEDCIITNITVRKGIACVKEGDSVKKGDVLISGQIPIYNDTREIIQYKYCFADADITGRTSVFYQDKCENIFKTKIKEPISKKQYYIKVFQKRFCLGNIKNNYVNEEYESAEHKICNIRIGIRSTTPYKVIQEKYTQKEVLKLLNSNFDFYYKELEKKGVVILKNDVKIYRDNGKFYAKGNLYIEKETGDRQAAVPYQINTINKQSGDTINGNDGNNN